MGYLSDMARQITEAAREPRAPISPEGYSSAELHRLVRLWHARAGLDPGGAERIIALLKRASPIGAESEFEHWRQMVADQERRQP